MEWSKLIEWGKDVAGDLATIVGALAASVAVAKRRGPASAPTTPADGGVEGVHRADFDAFRAECSHHKAECEADRKALRSDVAEDVERLREMVVDVQVDVGVALDRTGGHADGARRRK